MEILELKNTILILKNIYTHTYTKYKLAGDLLSEFLFADQERKGNLQGEFPSPMATRSKGYFRFVDRIFLWLLHW